MGWLKNTWRWLVSFAVGLPIVIAVFLWGKGWRNRAKAEESAKLAALEVAQAASKRAVKERLIRSLKETALKSLQLKYDNGKFKIEQQSKSISELKSAAARANAVFDKDSSD